MAFAKTFTSNLCYAADPSKEFPYLVMMKNKSLIKIHGSSMLSHNPFSTKWVCCQNLVISGVTKRPMAKFIVPISKNIMEKFDDMLSKKAKKLEENYTPKTYFSTLVSTAVLRFLRGKNHDEYIQSKLKKYDAYLETDEDQEKIIFFFLSDKKKNRNINIIELQEKIEKYSNKKIFQRIYLAPMSDSTKLAINEEGQVFDILDSQQFTSLLVKSYNEDVLKVLLKNSQKLGLNSFEITIAQKKMAGISLVYFRDKYVAKAVFEKSEKTIRDKFKVPSSLSLTQCFPSAV